LTELTGWCKMAVYNLIYRFHDINTNDNLFVMEYHDDIPLLLHEITEIAQDVADEHFMRISQIGVDLVNSNDYN